MGKPQPVAEPSPAQTARMEREAQNRQERLAELAALACLRDVSTEELESLIDLCTFRVFLAHETIIHERNPVNFLYLVLRGSVRLALHDKEGREVLIGMLERGDCYGEGSLFGDFFRHARAVAETHCYVIQLPLTAVRALLPSTPQLREALRDVYLRRLAEFTLARVPLFSRLSPDERMSLTCLLKSAHYPRGTIVVRQGTPGDALYLIEVGQVVIERDEQPIASMAEGDFFGEMSLLSDQPHSATVQTLTPSEMVMLPADDFHKLLEQRPELESSFRHVIEQRRRATTEAVQGDQERANRLTLSVQKGLLRGSHLLVRTPAMCPPGCRICEMACEKRHGHLRLHLNGAAIGNRDVLDACRQCRVGAECVEACPEEAIVWDDQGALYINDACTGCGDCIPACPYDAVQRVRREQKKVRGLVTRARDTWQHLRRLPVIPLEPTVYTHRADKCDLCHGYDDMVCISACPTGSLRYVPVEEILPL
jgi:CRP-like cAMP-binding protein/NAD-dependent dihydropyrimidine dehydrogenase PreA subunit